MADTNPGGAVARIKTADLAKIWGDEVTIKKSDKSEKRYPLYLATKTGSVFFNTANGQDFLLEHGKYFGPDDPKPAPAPAEKPAAPAVKETLPPQPTPVKKSWFDREIL